MKVSLIIPVYNVENYLDKCLKSVEGQTYKDTEVIIVNDGSTDNSPKIIEDYVSQNENFHCYTIKNSGIGGARNFGLTKATGEYIVFLDSDDYITEDCLEKFVAAAQKNDSDIVVCNSYDVTEDGNIILLSENNINNDTTSLLQSPQILLNRPCAWGKMYRKSLFENLSYVSREWYEDLRLTPKLFLKSAKITYIDDALFFYVQRAGSVMNNPKVARNLEIIAAFEDVISYFKQNGFYEKFKEEFDCLIVEHVLIAAITRVVMSNGEERKSVLSKLQNFLLQFDGLYGNKYVSSLGFNKKLILFFNKNKLYFLTKLCMTVKSKLT